MLKLKGELLATCRQFGYLPPMYDDEEFKCPKCQAHYKVRMSSGTQVVNHLIRCKICKQPLAATDDGKILKYFLVRPSAGSGR
jgi:predicted SprT family Zn-dependent metalloprotease